MNLTRISCISPLSPLRYKGTDRSYGKLPYVCLLDGYLAIRVSDSYYYYRVESGSIEMYESAWAGDSGEDDFPVPRESPWSMIT